MSHISITCVFAQYVHMLQVGGILIPDQHHLPAATDAGAEKDIYLCATITRTL